MVVGLLIPGILLGLLVLGGVAVLPSVWRGDTPFLEGDGVAGLDWFWGDRVSRGLRRGIVAANVACAGLALALVLLGIGSGRAGFLVWAATGVALLGLAAVASIVLFNQPSWLVPPILRCEPGALSRRGWVTTPPR